MSKTHNAALAAIENICKKRGELLPHVVVNEARDENSPLHPYFDWSDKSAAEKYRLQQAENLIRRFKVQFVTADGQSHTMRRFLNVVVTKHRKAKGAEPLTYRAYVPAEQAMADDDMRAQVLHEALTMVRSWRQKYGTIQELAPIVHSIEAVESSLREQFT